MKRPFDLDPIDPEGRIDPEVWPPSRPLREDRRPLLLVAPLAELEMAAAARVDLHGPGEFIRGLHRARDLVDRQHLVWSRAPAQHVEKTAARIGRVGHERLGVGAGGHERLRTGPRHSDADPVVTRRPITGYLRHDPCIDSQKHALPGGWSRQVIGIGGDKDIPLAIMVKRIVGIGKAERRGCRSPDDLFPVEIEPSWIVLPLGTDFGRGRLILRPSRGGIDRLLPEPKAFLDADLPFELSQSGSVFNLLRFHPMLPHRARIRGLGECGRDRTLAQFAIGLELVGRHEERVPDGVERGVARIGGQALHVDLDAEQFAESVCVFSTIEPPHGHDAARVGERLAGGHERVGQVVKQIRLGSHFDLLLVVGRHLARIHHVEHLLPSVGGLDRINRG